MANSYKILSWDVGIKNLAYCILQINDDNTFGILDWNVIDLTNNNNEQQHGDARDKCCHVNKTRKCNAKAIYQLNNISGNQPNDSIDKYCAKHLKIVKDELKQSLSFNDTINHRCSESKCTNIKVLNLQKKYYCCDHIDNFIKKQIKKIKYVKCNKISLDILCKNMYEQLDAKKNIFLNVERVYIENQPTHINPTMKTISSLLFGYFVLRGINEKSNNNSTISAISFCSPSNKINSILKQIKQNKDATNETLVNIDIDADKKNKYKTTKQMGIKLCCGLIDDKPTYLSQLHCHSKKDDMCDAFLQGFVLAFPQIPQHYCNMLMQILVK